MNVHKITKSIGDGNCICNIRYLIILRISLEYKKLLKQKLWHCNMGFITYVKIKGMTKITHLGRKN